ncbi:hypothetical protein BS78_06G188700 [Paspalum vaginatum]|nr:hypothetical protein BS78_06G188700 [Paspalum vaginatum]
MQYAWNTVGMKLCARRILSFLRRYALEATAHQFERQTAVVFSPSHLEFLVMSGRWSDVMAYVYRFLTPLDGTPPSSESSTFFMRLHVYSVLGGIYAAAGDERHAKGVRTMYPLLDAAAALANPATASLHALFHRALQRPPRDFASRMRFLAAAAKTLKRLALECPELKGKLELPRSHAPETWQISLAGVRPAPRPYIKKKKKVNNKQKARDIASLIVGKRDSGTTSRCSRSGVGRRAAKKLKEIMQCNASRWEKQRK